MLQRAKRVWRATRVEPGQQLLEAPLERHRARLVDKLQSGAKTGDHDGTAAAVPITGAALQTVHVAKHAGGCERLGDGGPVGAQVAEEFKAAIHPSVDATDDRARHHRVFLQQRGERLGPREPLQETVKSRLGRVAGEQSLQPRHVDLKRHGTADDVKQLRRQLAKEQRRHRVGVERHVGVPASQCLNARLQPRHALPDKGSAGVQEARRVIMIGRGRRVRAGTDGWRLVRLRREGGVDLHEPIGPCPARPDHSIARRLARFAQ